MPRSPLHATLSLLAFAACAGEADKPASDKASADDSALPAAVARVCADGTWSGWDSPDGLVFVDPAGSDTSGDGSVAAPYQTLQQALRGSMGDGEIRVALGAGTYQGPFVLLQGPAGVSLTVQGCGPDETVFTHDLGQSADADVAIAGSTPITLARLRIEDPDGAGVVVRRGANATLANLRVERPRGIGVGVIGATATLRDVEISDARPGVRLRGWGVVGVDAALTLEDVTVPTRQVMGVYQRGGSLAATRLALNGGGTPSVGRHGFGVYAHELDLVQIVDSVVEDAHSVGMLFIDATAVTLTNNRVTRVEPGGTGGGDGIMVARLHATDPLQATLSGNTVSGAARMGIALAGVTAALSGNTAGADNGHVVDGRSIFADPSATVTGDPAAPFDRAELRILVAYSQETPRFWSQRP